MGDDVVAQSLSLSHLAQPPLKFALQICQPCNNGCGGTKLVIIAPCSATTQICFANLPTLTATDFARSAYNARKRATPHPPQAVPLPPQMGKACLRRAPHFVGARVAARVLPAEKPIRPAPTVAWQDFYALRAEIRSRSEHIHCKYCLWQYLVGFAAGNTLYISTLYIVHCTLQTAL